MKATLFAATLALATQAACSNSYSPTGTATSGPSHTDYSAQGDSTTVATTLDAFRAALGGILNAPNSPAIDSGRREINWDGVPAALTNVDTFPARFFNTNSKRGAVFSTPGSGLRVDSTDFGAIDPSLAIQFRFFSPKKLFMAVGSNQVEVDFEVVGTTVPGLVKGFGVIFSDVDRVGSTRVQYYDANGTLIADLAARARSGVHEYSVVGAVFQSPIVAKVIITSGDAALNSTITDVSAGGTRDLVVMDDFVYGEPQPRQ